MQNLVTAILMFCVLLTACQQSANTSRAEASPKAETLFTPHDATLAQQKMCDEQAAKRFKEYTATKPSRDFDAYSSHYDPTVNVCYARIDQTLIEHNVPGISTNVIDAFEGREFATYIWTNPQHKQYSEVTPTICEITIPGKDTIKCSSSEEFDNLTEKYFGVAK